MAGRTRLKSWNLTTCVLGFILMEYAVYCAVPYFSDFHFRQEPVSMVTKRGNSTLLNCSAVQGQSSPEIQWLKDGELLKDSQRRYTLSNGSLYFTQVVQDKGDSDKGGYQCRATVQGLGTIISRTAKLDVAHLPRLLDPADVDVHLNDTAVFQCTSDGLPTPTINWFKNGILLKPDSRIHIYPTGILEISLVTEGDFANYNCEVFNSDRLRTSPKVRLSQRAKDIVTENQAPVFILTPQRQQAVIGEPVYLHCAANGPDHLGNPPRIVWLKDGVTVDFSSNTSHIQLLGTGTLHINEVRNDDSGTYTCRALNTEDSVDADVLLNVFVPPYFIQTPANIFAHTNSDVLMQCEVGGNPVPEVTWRKNGEKVYPSDYFQLLGGSNLKILGLLNSDGGIYQCFAENILGDIQAIAQLIILPADTPLPTTRAPHSAVLPAGSQYADARKLPASPTQLRAVLVSRRFITVSWQRPEDTQVTDTITYAVYWREQGSERERVSNTTQTEFNIQNLKPDTVYEIRVRAYNMHGPSQREAAISVTTDQEVHVPSPPVNLRATPLSSTSIIVQWEAPQDPKGEISHYSLIYYEVGSTGEQEVKVFGKEHILKSLNTFREYSVRVVAHNQNGPGMSTAEVVTRTFSNTPSATPQNFTLEVSSATRIIVRWEPPPPETQNGIIVGYKIRYKIQPSGRGDTVVTDGNRNTYALTDLEKGTEYKVRISALTVNGSGPTTSWLDATTYHSDLDESQVPPGPARLQAKPLANQIVVQWAPPAPDSKILVRGYILGYGRGIADVYQLRLDANTHDYTIKNLQPTSEYVISIKAFNNVGYGPSAYETVKTSEDIVEEPATPMMPPIGLKAIVLTSSTIVLTWADDSLGKSQKIVDERFYTVRFSYLPRGRNKFINATDLVAHIDGLRPNTQYVFAVRVINGRRQSTWSMSVTNTTLEDAPGSEPRDLTPVPIEKDHLAVSLHWQPPQRPNGQITGYLIFYTTDAQQDDRDWVVDGLNGDKLSTVISELTPDTTYYFKVQARNRKGYGPMSRTVKYLTPSATESQQAPSGESGGLSSTTLIIIIISCVVGVSFIVAVAVGTVVLCRCRENAQNRGSYKSPVKAIKATGKDVPPDLWIHQPSHLELQCMDKGRRSESSVSVANSTLPRGSQTSTDRLDDVSSNAELDRRRNSFVGESGYPSSGEERYQSAQPRNIIRPKPITLPVDTQMPAREPVATVTALPNGQILGYGDPGIAVMGPMGMRPVYPRTQYNTQYTGAQPPRVHAGDIPHSTGSKMMSIPSDREDMEDRPIDGRDDSYPARIVYVKPQPNHSPYKKPSPPVSSGPVKTRSQLPFSSKAPDITQHSKTDQDMTKSLSTEELSAEMANLEGLMKDLNAITQQEFEC